MLCMYKECVSEEIVNRGLCALHYPLLAELVREPMTWLAFERLGLALPKTKPIFQCSVSGCAARRHKAKGLCALHYAKEVYRQSKSLCEFVGCERQPNTANSDSSTALLDDKAYCGIHYNELFKPS